VHCALGISPRQGLACLAHGVPAHLACGPTRRKQGTALRRWGIPASRHRRWVVNKSCGRAVVWWTGLRRERGWSCPWRCLRLMGKWRGKHGPGVEGAGDWVWELRDAAPELGDGSAGGSEGPGRHCMVIPQQRHDSTVGAEGGGRRNSLSRGSGSLYSW
jgi:hypothetical protein